MPMIDVYAAAGTFREPDGLAQQLATTLMTIEQVPNIPMFPKSTAAFVPWVLLTQAYEGRLGSWGPREHER
jgi:hypothetical protein